MTSPHDVVDADYWRLRGYLSRRRFQIGARRVSDQDCRLAFLNWVAYVKELSPDAKADHLKCPMVDCRQEGFQDLKSLLTHVSTCEELPAAHYWCPYCCRGEHFGARGLPNVSFAVNATNKDCLLKKACDFFKRFGRTRRKIHQTDREELDTSLPLPSTQRVGTFQRPTESGAKKTEVCTKELEKQCSTDDRIYRRNITLPSRCELRVSTPDWHNELPGSPPPATREEAPSPDLDMLYGHFRLPFAELGAGEPHCTVEHCSTASLCADYDLPFLNSPGFVWRCPIGHRRHLQDRLSTISGSDQPTHHRQDSGSSSEEILPLLEGEEGLASAVDPDGHELAYAQSGESIIEAAPLGQHPRLEQTSVQVDRGGEVGNLSRELVYQLGVPNTPTQAGLLFHSFYMLHDVWKDALSDWPELEILIAKLSTSSSFASGLQALRNFLDDMTPTTLTGVFALVQLSYVCAYMCHSNDKSFQWDDFFNNVLQWAEAISDQQDRYTYSKIFEQLQFVPEMSLSLERTAAPMLGQRSRHILSSQSQHNGTEESTVRTPNLRLALGQGAVIKCCIRFLDGMFFFPSAYME